jgi:NAD(P)-dependent dehydrogenase (short-subunit alcohol dehydrogenase family)
MALIGLARPLAAELSRNEIGVDPVTPGLMRTEGNSDPDMDLIEQQVVAMQIPKRPMASDVLRTTLLYLASSASAAVTGQTINVDAGVGRT